MIKQVWTLCVSFFGVSFLVAAAAAAAVADHYQLGHIDTAQLSAHQQLLLPLITFPLVVICNTAALTHSQTIKK